MKKSILIVVGLIMLLSLSACSTGNPKIDSWVCNAFENEEACASAVTPADENKVDPSTDVDTDIDPAAASCPQARDLGPWAPGADGLGESFEVTASDQGASNLSSSGVVLGLWWPHGKTAWGTQEITTLLPRGMSITVIDGAGRGWDYEARCGLAEVESQMDEHMAARKNDTAYHGFVSIEDLISAGLVEVRFDRR